MTEPNWVFELRPTVNPDVVRVEVIVACRLCGDCFTEYASKEEYDKYINGASVSEAFTSWSPIMLGMILSRTCDGCYEEAEPLENDCAN